MARQERRQGTAKRADAESPVDCMASLLLWRFSLAKAKVLNEGHPHHMTSRKLLRVEDCLEPTWG